METYSSLHQAMVAARASEEARDEVRPLRGMDGNARSRECPRKGVVYLQRGVDLVMVETRCKTWRCLACRESRKAKLEMLIEGGALTLGSCVFITLTFRLRGRIPCILCNRCMTRDARSARGALRRFWYRYKKERPEEAKTIQWLMIVEMTKRNQPHFHMVVSGLERTRAEIERDWSFRWQRATGDSWMVDSRPLRDARHAARYMAKYLTKNSQHRVELERAGFRRRYARSSGWPDLEVQYVGSQKGWDKTEFRYGRPADADFLLARSKGHRLLAWTGTSEALAMVRLREQRVARGQIKTLEGYIREHLSETVQQHSSGSGDRPGDLRIPDASQEHPEPRLGQG